MALYVHCAVHFAHSGDGGIDDPSALLGHSHAGLPDTGVRGAGFHASHTGHRVWQRIMRCAGVDTYDPGSWCACFRLITGVAGYSCYLRSDPQPSPTILHTGPRRGLLGKSQIRHLGCRRVPGSAQFALVSRDLLPATARVFGPVADAVVERPVLRCKLRCCRTFFVGPLG